jgi:hypothetical protein
MKTAGLCTATREFGHRVAYVHSIQQEHGPACILLDKQIAVCLSRPGQRIARQPSGHIMVTHDPAFNAVPAGKEVPCPTQFDW